MNTKQSATLDRDAKKPAELSPISQEGTSNSSKSVALRRSQLAAARSIAANAIAEVAPPSNTLVVGAVNDPHEREADEMAQRVVTSIRESRAASTAGRSTPGANRAPSTGRVAQRRGGIGVDGGNVDSDTHASIQGARGGGAALDVGLRGDMEGAFGADFSAVRVHTDGQSADLNERLSAEAFTIGTDVFLSRSYDAASSTDQELLAHELTHVVQQGGAGDLQRKMWTKSAFSTATREGLFTAKSGAQETIEDLIKTYASTVEAHGVVAPSDTAKAINLLLNMQRASEIWIDDHMVDVDNQLGGVDTIADPSRKKRMAGMRLFQGFLRTEILTYQNSQRDAGDEVSVDIESKSEKLIKYEDRKQQASSVLEGIGKILSKAASSDGDSTTVEVEIKFPVEPSGIGFLGGRFLAEASKDDGKFKVRTELAITGGADCNWLEIKGEVGGFIEAQADTAEDAMALVSYALYRRFRESNAVPSEVSNFLWGGNWGSYGKAKADRWSRMMEERMFTVPEPEMSDFSAQYPDDDVRATEEFGKARVAAEKRRDDIRENVYVESGGLAGVKVSADAEVVKGELAVGGTAGKRIDMTSLENRKGGAGKENKRSSGVGAAILGAVSGGTRGAEKSVARGSRSVTMSAKLEGKVPHFTKLSGSSQLGLAWMNQGLVAAERAKQPSGKDPYVLTKNELEFALEAELPFGKLGPGIGKMVDWLSGKAVDSVRDAVDAVNEKPVEPETDMGMVKKQLSDMKSAAGILKDAATPAAESQAAATDSGMSGSASLKVKLTLDGMKPNIEGALDFSRVDTKEAKIPKIIEAKVERSKRIVKIAFDSSGFKGVS